MRSTGLAFAAVGALFGAGLLIAAHALAEGESVKALFEKHDLLGTFAYDCGRPVSKDNLYFINRVIDEGRVQRDAMSGQSTRDWVAIIDKAVELTSDELSVSGKRNGLPSEGVWRLEKNRMRAEESTLGDKKLVVGGKFTSNGKDTPWVNKCDAPGTQAQSSPANPAASPRAQDGSVKALFEKYKLLGVFARDCNKPPQRDENWYYVNRLIDSNHVQHDVMESERTRAMVMIIDRASELRANEIVVMGMLDNKPTAAVWRLETGRMVQWEAAVDGQLKISGGKLVKTGADVPWSTRCGD